MRDIRDGLTERLKTIEAERRHLNFQLRELEIREARLTELLAEENVRYGDEGQLPIRSADAIYPPEMPGLSRFLLHVMTRQNDWPLGVLAKLAVDENMIDEKGSPGRKVHGALGGLMQRKLVDRNDHKNWQLVKKDAPPERTDEASNSEGAA